MEVERDVIRKGRSIAFFYKTSDCRLQITVLDFKLLQIKYYNSRFLPADRTLYRFHESGCVIQRSVQMPHNLTRKRVQLQGSYKSNLQLLEFYFSLSQSLSIQLQQFNLVYFWCSKELSEEALMYLRAPVIPIDLDREKSQDILWEPMQIWNWWNSHYLLQTTYVFCFYFHYWAGYQHSS